MDLLAKKLAGESLPSTLYDLNKFFDDESFVGDEPTRLCIPIALIRRKSIGVVSGSGTGKSAIVDTALKLFKPHHIYKMGSGSEKAQAYKSEEINRANIINISELQKMANGDVAIEMLKDLGEGKDYVREVVSNGGASQNKVQQIKSGKAIIYTKAIENEFKTDDELQRRYPNFTTDMSKEQNENVNKSKASRRSRPFKKPRLTTLEKHALESHMNKLLTKDANKYVFINPMADFLVGKIPATFAISRTYTDHYFDFIEGVAFFNSDSRISDVISVDGKDKHVIFVAPEDVWQLHKIYWKQFLQDVMNLPPNGIKVIEAFLYAKKNNVKSEVKTGYFSAAEKDERTKLTIRGLFNVLKEMGIVVKENMIKKIVDSLRESGYVNEDISGTGNRNNPEYYMNDDSFSLEEFIDWDAGIKHAVDFMQKEYPQYAEKYVNQFCVSPQAIDPFNGKKVLINSFTSKPVQQKDTRENWMDDDD